MSHGSAPQLGRPLPNARLAEVPVRKLRDYVLDPEHPKGAPKARLWRAVFDVGREDWRYLRTELLAGLLTEPVSTIHLAESVPTYGVVVAITGLNGRCGPALTAWKLVGGVPHLVTTFPRV